MYFNEMKTRNKELTAPQNRHLGRFAFRAIWRTLTVESFVVDNRQCHPGDLTADQPM